MCNMADGANSQQQEILGQLLFRWDKDTGRLDSRVISISSSSDKTAEGQRVAYKNAQAALAETAEAVGLIDQLAERQGGGAADAAAAAHAAAVAVTAAAAAALAAVTADVATITAAIAAATAAAAAVSTNAAAAAAADSAGSSCDLAAALADAVAALAAATADAVAARAVATAAAARSVATAAAAANGAGSSSDHAANGAGSNSEAADAAAFFELRRQLKAHLCDLTPVSSMNDRATNGRAAGRLVRGVGLGDEMPTCAEHAAVNIGAAGMKAVDAALRLAMNIMDESAALDKEKIKGLATAIGWNSSPCNALSYAIAK